MTILVTGFEPFAGAESNPSWEAVRLLPEMPGHGATLRRLLLPVEYTRAGDLIAREMAACSPSLVICVGVAAGRKSVTPELVAVNWRMASIPDEAGVQYSGVQIDPAAPAARMTTLPVMTLVDAVQKAGIPCQLSLSAGGYVCNDLYWRLLEETQRLGIPGLFVHVPAEADLPVQSSARALEACMEAILHVQEGGN